MSNALGLPKQAVALQPPTAEWAEQFRHEAARLSAVIGDYVLDIQHIGSTSVPGLPAKPIIDIGVAVADFDEAQRCIPPLRELGYHYLGELGIPRRHYFVLGRDEERTHHLHILEIHSADWRQHLALRDHLRQQPPVAQAYAALKQRLATEYPNERRIYTEGKSGFITRLLRTLLPDLWPKVGDKVTVHVFKSDRSRYRSWPTTVEAIEDDRIVTVSPVGTIVTDYRKGDWVVDGAVRRYLWFDRPYHLLEYYSPSGNLLELYVDIARPILVKQHELIFFDYELDVVKRTGEATFIADEDEFAEAAQRLGYSSKFQSYCYQAAHEAIALVEGWQAKGHP